MSKKKSCYIIEDPHRAATWWDDRRRIIPGTAHGGSRGLIWDPKVQGPPRRVSCYRAFLEDKKRARETGVLRAYYTCDKGYPPNRRIEAYGGYPFSKEVQEVNRWESNWGDGRIAMRFKWGDEIWVGTIHQGAGFTHCEPDPNGHDWCHRYEQVVDPDTGGWRWRSLPEVRGRKTRVYNMGDCTDGVYGVFRRAAWERTLSPNQRDFPFEYKRRSKTSLMKHWKATAEERKEQRQKERQERLFFGQRFLR